MNEYSNSIQGEIKMQVTWNNDEGREIFFSKIKNKYKITDDDYSTGIYRLIEEIIKEKQMVEKKNDEKEKNINHLNSRKEEIESQINHLKKEIAVQEDYYKIEEKKEYKNRIDSFHSSIENSKKQLDEVITKLDKLYNEPKAEFLKSELLTSYLKFNSYLGANYRSSENQHGIKLEIDLPPLFKGEEVAFSTEEYKRVLDAFKKQNIENVYYYSRNLIFSEEDKKECKPEEWELFSRMAVEIKESLLAAGDSVYKMNNRLFVKYGPDCFCQVKAYRIKENIDFNSFNIGIAENRQPEEHPIYPQFRIKYPNNFIVFNEGIILKHVFYVNQTGLRLKFRKEDERIDDDD